MTREEAINRLKEGEPFSEIYEPVWNEALDMAIKALQQIDDIKKIISSDIYIQEDVIRYKMICEVVK